jgi:ubiquinone/menaquinone biosynthesis C-methylase UbiE
MKLKTENNNTWHNHWDRVDNSSNPDWFVKFLDASRLRQLEVMKKDPSQFFTFLDVSRDMHILDVGCGTGILLHPLAELVGEQGRIVGIDASEFMVKEARKRAESTDLPLEFYKGDVYELAFPNNAFDRATASTLFQHLKRPGEALFEMKRVVKPGGLIAVWEQDWETLMFDSNYKETTRKIANYFCDMTHNGWIGRKLNGLFNKAGLKDTKVTPMTLSLTYEDFLNPTFGFYQTAQRCVDEEIIKQEEKELWLKDLEERSNSGEFMLAFTAFRVVGRKE